MPMIKATNPIHELRDIQTEINRLLLRLAPFYAALDLVVSDDDLGVERLEAIPAFREPWLAKRELEQKAERIMMRLALSYEQSPVANW